MTTFDAPNRESFCVRRERSNTPLQALVLLNDIQHFEAARNFGQRIIKEGGKTAPERIDWAFRMVASRHPSDKEKSALLQLLDEELNRYRGDIDSARKAISFGESKADTSLDPAELAAYSLVGNLLLNLDEVVMKN